MAASVSTACSGAVEVLESAQQEIVRRRFPIINLGRFHLKFDLTVKLRNWRGGLYWVEREFVEREGWVVISIGRTRNAEEELYDQYEYDIVATTEFEL